MPEYTALQAAGLLGIKVGTVYKHIMVIDRSLKHEQIYISEKGMEQLKELIK